MESILEKTHTWDSILKWIEKTVGEFVYENWFTKVEFGGFDDEAKAIRLKTGTVTREWLVMYYKGLIEQALTLHDHADYTIEWTIDTEAAEDDRLTRQIEDVFDSKHNDRQNSDPVRVVPARTSSTNFVDIEPVENSLNPKYTFDKFVVGSSNQFAHAASLGAAESPGKTYNPLFIYGGVGLGKTHLMHAIGHSIKQRDRHLRVSYITSEKFMNELINAIRYDKTQSFREKYRSIDVLLMDDVQFMAGKERTQEEFFHTFNQLHNDQKQIVISSDCPPRDIPTLEERLHSRFEWGLIADIEPPDLETKVAILKRKADLDGIELPDEVAIFMANNIRSNVRELEGSLVRLVAISSLRDMPISKMLAQDALKNVIDSERPERLSMERIARAVAAHYKMSVDEMKSKSNARSIAGPRQLAMYLCKRLTKHSYPEIGREFGGKHHTTVMHSFEKIESQIKDDRNFHRTVSELIDNLCN